MNARTDAHRLAFDAQLRLCGERGTYRTASDDSGESIRAVRGQTPFREENADRTGSFLNRSVDWLFPLMEFRRKFGAWPQEGQTYSVALDVPGHDPTLPATFGPNEEPVAIVTTYRVSSFNGEPCYRIDPTNTFLRIHTREQSAEPGC